jgi:hypothetical protein
MMSNTERERVEVDSRDRTAARAVIASHSIQHVYGQGFYVILPEL